MLLNIIKPYVLAFIPIFFAVDIIGTIPIFLSLTETVSEKQRKKIVLDSVVTATLLAVVFSCLGKLILKGLGITIFDFKVAGGILLFILSVYLLLPGKSRDFVAQSLTEDIGIFPLATPLITGPAVLITTMMLLDTAGPIVTLVALFFNMLIAWIALRCSGTLLKLLGDSSIKALSKISYIFLAAIGVMILRQGISGLLTYLKG